MLASSGGKPAMLAGGPGAGAALCCCTNVRDDNSVWDRMGRYSSMTACTRMRRQACRHSLQLRAEGRAERMTRASWVAFGVAFFLAADFFRGDLTGAGAGAPARGVIAGALAANRSALALLDAEVCCAKDGSAARRSTCLTSDSIRGWKSAAPVSPTSARSPFATCCRSIGTSAAAAPTHVCQSDSGPQPQAPGPLAERVDVGGR